MFGPKNKYSLMFPSATETDNLGNSYPDLATFEIETFSPIAKPRVYQLSEQNVYRFDLLTDDLYGDYAFYDDFTLWINNIPFIDTDDNIETTINLYNKQDIDVWFLSQVK